MKKVKFVSTQHGLWLTLGKTYTVLNEHADSYLVTNDKDKESSYSKSNFIPVDDDQSETSDEVKLRDSIAVLQSYGFTFFSKPGATRTCNGREVMNAVFPTFSRKQELLTIIEDAQARLDELK